MIMTVLAIMAAFAFAPGADARPDPTPATQAGDAAPVAQIRIFASDGRHGRRNDLVNGSSATLCVASTTGRYRLHVLSNSGGVMRGSDVRAGLAFRVRFRDASGSEQVKQMDGGEIVFEGRSPGQADCRGGANAFLLVDSPESDILKNVAGEYADRLTLSVEPL